MNDEKLIAMLEAQNYMLSAIAIKLDMPKEITDTFIKYQIEARFIEETR